MSTSLKDFLKQKAALYATEGEKNKLTIEEGACFEGTSCRREDPLNAELPSPKPIIKSNGKYHESEAVAA